MLIAPIVTVHRLLSVTLKLANLLEHDHVRFEWFLTYSLAVKDSSKFKQLISPEKTKFLPYLVQQISTGNRKQIKVTYIFSIIALVSIEIAKLSLNEATGDLGHHRLRACQIRLANFALYGKTEQVPRQFVVELLARIRRVELQWF